MSNLASDLRAMAAQEGCDGEPWDTMMEAAAEIDQLKEALRGIEWSSQSQGDERTLRSALDHIHARTTESLNPNTTWSYYEKLNFQGFVIAVRRINRATGDAQYLTASSNRWHTELLTDREIEQTRKEQMGWRWTERREW